MTAKSQARWLANRPFLTQTHLTRTVVVDAPPGGSTGALRPGAKLLAGRSRSSSRRRSALSASTAGYWPGLVAEYTFVDVPNSGVTVIWSWAVNEHTRVLKDNQALIDTLSFGP